jgi:DNA-directed RNA polymerase subunit M/transcription elongation factor TFIIS
MQQLATEIRLLGVLLRQYEANARNAPAPGPFLVAVPPPSSPHEEEAVEPAVEQSVADAPEVAPEVPVSLPPAESIPVEKPAPPASGAPPVVLLGRDSFGRPTPKAPAERQPAGGRCPKCDSPEIYVSRARSHFERMLDRWGVPLCRCHRCYHRYVVFARLRISKDMPATTERKFRPRRRHA